MRKIILGLVAATAVAAPLAMAGSAHASGAPVTTTHDIAVDVTSEVPTELPALNSQFTKMTLTASGVNNWNFGDAEHVTSYDAAGGMHTNFPYIHGEVDWNGVHYAALVGEDIQVGTVLYRVNGGAWKAVDGEVKIDGGGKVVHVEVITNDRPEWFGDNTGAESVHVVRTKA